MEASSQNPIPIAVLLTLAAIFLYLHFSNGSGFMRLMLAAALVVASVILLLPSFQAAAARLFRHHAENPAWDWICRAGPICCSR